MNFRKQVKPNNSEKKQQKEDVLENLSLSIGFSVKVSDHSNLKILTPKEMLQRLPIVLVQVKAGNTSKNLLNEIRQMIYSLYGAKEITKKCITI